MKKKQKILILQERLFDSPNANSKVVFRICARLRQIGCDVHVLGVAKTATEHIVEYGGIHLIHEPADRVKDIRDLKQRLGRFSWLGYVLRPRSIWYRINNKRSTPFYLEARLWLHKHVSEYDILIACCSPYYTIALAAECAGQIPLIYYKLDPIGVKHGQGDADGAMATVENEMVWDNVASRIITTHAAFGSYVQLPTRVNASKVVLAYFPNIYERKLSGHKINIAAYFGINTYNLFFVGRFYYHLRHPQFLFDLMERLKDTTIVLHIVGPLDGKMGFEKEFVDKYFTNKIPNIRFHGAVPPEEADDLLLLADGLVHVGNAQECWMPSKILDYISSGKPILNICKIRNCPTLPLMERYPIGMTIFEDEGISDLVSERVREFCMQNKGRQVPYEQIEKLYPECTIEYVGKQFDDTIQTAIKEFKQKQI